MFKRSYECLYTNQKTQKNKRWQEGICEIVFTGETAKMHLFNNTKKRIESCFVNISDKNEIPEEYTLPTYLVQLNDVNEFEETEESQIHQKKKNGKGEESKEPADNDNCRNKRRIINYSGNKDEYHNKRVKENQETDKNVSNGIIEAGRRNNNNNNKGIVNTIHKGIFGKNIKIGLSGPGGGIQKFNIPRTIQVEEKEKQEDRQCITSKHNPSYEKNNANYKKDTMEKETNRFISVTYTQKNYFEKKHVKWFDGFITLDYSTNDTLVTLYNESQKKIIQKRMVLPEPEEKECIHIGYYVINNDFSEQSSGLPMAEARKEVTKKYKPPDPYISPRKKMTKENGRNNQNINGFEYKDMVQNRNHPINNFSNVSNKNHRNTYRNPFSNEHAKKSTFLEDQNLNCTPRKNGTINMKRSNSNEEECCIYRNESKECILFYEKKHIFKEYDSSIEETDVCEDIINIGKFVCQNNFDCLKNFMSPLYIPIIDNKGEDPCLEDGAILENFKNKKEEPKILSGGNPKRTIYDYFGTSCNKNNEVDLKNIEKNILVRGEEKGCILKNEVYDENIRHSIIEECDLKKEINQAQIKDLVEEITATTNHTNECGNNKITHSELSNTPSKILH